jgi:hypothetical protein
MTLAAAPGSEFPTSGGKELVAARVGPREGYVRASIKRKRMSRNFTDILYKEERGVATITITPQGAERFPGAYRRGTDTGFSQGRVGTRTLVSSC